MARLDRLDRPGAAQSAPDDEEAVYRERARRLGLSYTPEVTLGRHARSSLDAIRRGTFAMDGEPGGIGYLAPDHDMMPSIGRWLLTQPAARHRLMIATPTAIRAALRDCDRRSYHRQAWRRLESIDPDMSARRTLTYRQAITGFVLVALVSTALAVLPSATLVAVNLIAAAFFLSVSLLRFAAAGHVPLRLRKPPIAGDATGLPIYTILVPLLHEAHIVDQLVAALDRINWPRDRLDIKMIVEEDDSLTHAALRRAARGAPYEIIVVPDGGPRTKPMALQYAMTFARGDLVTIYDAEDRPHPDQLREALEAFRQGDAGLGCLQAPIVIDNAGASRIARLFAVEYSTLFDGLLPALARFRLPLPLGGTSNHFRRAALDAVGGWDPYNVTEDADLGIRLVRSGYRAATITLPTYEEAPATATTWIYQRTRWFKGWMQTWLVHMRHPMRIGREIGARRMLGFNLIGLGMIISAVAHPAFLATPFLLARDPLAMWRGGDLLVAAVVGLNLFNLIAGYLAVTILAGRTLHLRGREKDRPVLVWLPVYWLMMGYACLRAVVQLVRRPHHWEKTPHVGRRGPARSFRVARTQPRLAASRRRNRLTSRLSR